MESSPNEELQRILKPFLQYYDTKIEGVCAPFDAEAEFRSHDEQFFLVRSARISETESNEFVFIGRMSSFRNFGSLLQKFGG